jgi:2-polyprenyl-3-methyl-5-hydroxy-6-metoxy-1,4-benzoquinol methylase
LDTLAATLRDATRTRAATVELEDRHWWHSIRRRIVRDSLERLCVSPGSRLLDAGCGSGGMLATLSDFGQVSGIDMNPESVALARGRGFQDIREGAVEQLPW